LLISQIYLLKKKIFEDENVYQNLVNEFNNLFHIKIEESLNKIDNKWPHGKKPTSISYHESDQYHLDFINYGTELIKRIFTKRIFEFEKDDDLHVNMIRTISNIYSYVFGVPFATDQDVRIVAGKMQNGIITSASIATGLLALNLFGIVNDLSLKNLFNSSFEESCLSFSILEERNELKVKTLNLNTTCSFEEVCKMLLPEDVDVFEFIYFEKTTRFRDLNLSAYECIKSGCDDIDLLSRDIWLYCETRKLPENNYRYKKLILKIYFE